MIGLELILLTALALSHQWSGAALIDAYEGRGRRPGRVGLSEPPIDFLGPFLTGVIYLLLFLWGICCSFGLRWHDVQNGVGGLSQVEEVGRRESPLRIVREHRPAAARCPPLLPGPVVAVFRIAASEPNAVVRGAFHLLIS